MKANEMPNHELLKRDCLALFNEVRDNRERNEELLKQVNESIKYLQSRQSYKTGQLYETKDPVLTATFQGELKGYKTGLKQLDKIKALLRLYGI
jgi:hypothetical protein